MPDLPREDGRPWQVADGLAGETWRDGGDHGGCSAELRLGATMTGAAMASYGTAA